MGFQIACGKRWNLNFAVGYQAGTSWFLWGWRPSVFPDTRFWRVYPFTLFVVDRAD